MGIKQFIGRDLFASEIGRNFLALGMDSSISRTIRFVYEGNSRSSVYMASYTPNYAGMYLVMVLPVLFVLALQAKKIGYKILWTCLIGILLVCLYGTGSKAGFLPGYVC